MTLEGALVLPATPGVLAAAGFDAVAAARTRVVAPLLAGGRAAIPAAPCAVALATDGEAAAVLAPGLYQPGPQFRSMLAVAGRCAA